MSAIGDVCHTLPVVRRLQDNWPDCQITWVIGKLEATLVGDVPGIEFIVIDKRDMPGSLRSLSERMQSRHYDALLHMQAALRASRFARRIPADIRLGYDRERAVDFQWLFTNARIHTAPRQHVMNTLMGFADALGAQKTPIRWDIPIPDDARAFIATAVSAEKPYLVIVPCSSQRARNFRNWPVDSYAAAATYAAENHGLQIVLAGGNSELEQQYARDITAHCESPVVNLVGNTSLKQLLALLDKAAAVISPDTGPAHMAGAVNTPVIGLFASSNLQRTGPIHPEYCVDHYPAALKEATGKSVGDAKWGQRVRDPEVMLRIKPAEVCEQIDQVMAQHRA